MEARDQRENRTYSEIQMQSSGSVGTCSSGIFHVDHTTLKNYLGSINRGWKLSECEWWFDMCIYCVWMSTIKVTIAIHSVEYTARSFTSYSWMHVSFSEHISQVSHHFQPMVNPPLCIFVFDYIPPVRSSNIFLSVSFYLDITQYHALWTHPCHFKLQCFLLFMAE